MRLRAKEAKLKKKVYGLRTKLNVAQEKLDTLKTRKKVPKQGK